MGALRNAVLILALASAAPATAQVDRWSVPIAEASNRFGIPQAWITRVMQAESGGRTRLNGQPITSRAGAQGLMQLMPGTWREMRDVHGLGADVHDPRDNIIAGTGYLRMMYDRFGYPGLFAAYNAGPARYAEHLARGRRLPTETVAYVTSVGGTSPERAAMAPSLSRMSGVFVTLAGARPSGMDTVPPLETSQSLFVPLNMAASSDQSHIRRLSEPNGAASF